MLEKTAICGYDPAEILELVNDFIAAEKDLHSPEKVSHSPLQPLIAQLEELVFIFEAKLEMYKLDV